MTTTPRGDQQRLQAELDRALDSRPSGADLVELVISAGWQPRPTPDSNSDYLDGLLADGTRVQVEIRHASVRRVG